MIYKTFQVPFSELNLTVPQIEKVIGYDEGQAQETISEFISKCLKEAKEFSLVKSEYAVFTDVKFIDATKSVEINGIVFNLGKIVYGQLKRSDSIAIFLCTAGEEIGIHSRMAMKEGNLLEGYFYDVIGSEIADLAADFVQKDLEIGIASIGKKITNRYSPGYCRWDVSEQHKLFRLMPDNFCGIRLTPSALMDPVKSVSGFIGIGNDVRFNPYTCNLCDMKDCIYRKVRGADKMK
jgi:hypothetical protein